MKLNPLHKIPKHDESDKISEPIIFRFLNTKVSNKLGTNLFYFIFCLYYIFVLCHYNEQIQQLSMVLLNIVGLLWQIETML